jgi:hypothetical protein
MLVVPERVQSPRAYRSVKDDEIVCGSVPVKELYASFSDFSVGCA